MCLNSIELYFQRRFLEAIARTPEYVRPVQQFSARPGVRHRPVHEFALDVGLSLTPTLVLLVLRLLTPSIDRGTLGPSSLLGESWTAQPSHRAETHPA